MENINWINFYERENWTIFFRLRTSVTQFRFHSESPMDFDWSTRAMWNITEVEVRPFFIYLSIIIFFLKSSQKERSEGETVKQVKKKRKKINQSFVHILLLFPATWGSRSLKP